MSSSSLKTTTIQKGGNIKPATVSEHVISYNSLDNNNLNDPKVIEELVRNIAQLDKIGHEQIYLTLRKTKPKNFFAVNGLDTRFNMYSLNDQEKYELKRIIELCLEDMKRREVLQEAAGTHQQEINKLNDKLHIADIDEEAYVDSINPSEVDKIKEMLRMNQS